MKVLGFSLFLLAIVSCSIEIPVPSTISVPGAAKNESTKKSTAKMPSLGVEAQLKTMAEHAFQDIQQKASKSDLIVMFSPDKTMVNGYLADLLKANGYNLKIASDRNTSIEDGRLHINHKGFIGRANEMVISVFYKKWLITRTYNTQNNKATLISTTGWKLRYQ